MPDPHRTDAQLSSLLVRDAAEADATAIAAIYAVHVLHGTASFEEVPPDAGEIARRLREIVSSGRPYLVGELDGRIVGYAYAGPYRSRSAYRFTLEDSIYLDPAFAGRGLGSRLLAALVERCEAGPWREIVAIIGDSANASSIALHRKLGFTLVGTLKDVGFKHGRWLDSVVMQRRLRPSSSP
jgi:phosphinothricin acetyltransferase